MRYRAFKMIGVNQWEYFATGRTNNPSTIPDLERGDLVYHGDIYWLVIEEAPEIGEACKLEQASLGMDQMGELYSMAVKAEKARAGVA